MVLFIVSKIGRNGSVKGGCDLVCDASGWNFETNTTGRAWKRKTKKLPINNMQYFSWMQTKAGVYRIRTYREMLAYSTCLSTNVRLESNPVSTSSREAHGISNQYCQHTIFSDACGCNICPRNRVLMFWYIHW